MGKWLLYDVEEDISTLATFEPLMSHPVLFSQAHLDTSRTCVEWTDEIDLPSDAIYEFGYELMPVRTERGAG